MKLRYLDISAGRCGTRSLTHAMKLLGYKSCHGIPHHMRTEVIRCLVNGKLELPQYQKHHFVADVGRVHWHPLAWKYKRLRFILCVRNEDEWVESIFHNWKNARRWRAQTMCENLGAHNKDFLNLMLNWKILGSTRLNEKCLRAGYRQHNQTVMNYFKYSDRLLVMNICDGDGWDVLCPWLDVPRLNVSFPNTIERP